MNYFESIQTDVRDVFRSVAPLLADRDASPVHFRPCVVIRPTTRHTDDPSKVTCEPCKGMPAFAEAWDAQRAEIEGARLLAERSLLRAAVRRTTRAVEVQTEGLHRSAQRLSTALDDEKAARRDLADWEARQESGVSPAGSTESAETAGSVHESGPTFPTAQRAAEGLRVFVGGADLSSFVRDVSISRVGDHNPWAQRACPCPICTGRGYRKYVPGAY